MQALGKLSPSEKARAKKEKIQRQVSRYKEKAEHGMRYRGKMADKTCAVVVQECQD